MFEDFLRTADLMADDALLLLDLAENRPLTSVSLLNSLLTGELQGKNYDI